MLEALDRQQREYAERRRVAQQDHGPTFAQIIGTVLRSVDVVEQGDTLAASTPAELFAQARSLLEAKGSWTKPPHGSMYLVRAGERGYLELPPANAEIGGREVYLYLKEPSFIDPHDPHIQGKQGITKYYLGIRLRIGDDSMEMTEALVISAGGVSSVLFNGVNLTAPSILRRVSKILIKADRAIPSKV